MSSINRVSDFIRLNALNLNLASQGAKLVSSPQNNYTFLCDLNDLVVFNGNFSNNQLTSLDNFQCLSNQNLQTLE